MTIFQKSVIHNHLSQLDKNEIDKAFEKFKENYSEVKISEIKKLKEEEYQDGFLRDIFVDVLAYTLKPADNYNLAREFKNQTDGKKADGAILKNDNAIAVIELKSTKTKDLTSITQQAFNYKNNQPECKYVITSNFQKLRFYIDYANEYEEFDLFNLQKDDFSLLYLLLHKDSILADLPLKLKTETKFHEENISDKLYKDYSAFKHKIYENLVKNNPQYDKLTLFKKSQKFLDRLLFVFFAEDTGLVPPNAISKIIEQWQLFIDNDEYFSLYSRFVKFFGHLDKGHQYKTYSLPAYNGGLFAPDEILDNISIDDEILKNDTLHLSSYDYSTEVDVNILGHIFEHSLNEIEKITAEIEGTAQDKSKTKRKKDGIFYTPKYITQYIVENTIGKLCIEKRQELGIFEIEFDSSLKTKSGKISAKGKKLFESLQAYKDWLLTLKILDPACGSGVFLNQALNFLIEEHKQIDDIIAELTGEAMRLFDTDKAILENNLYGVDINEESVEIAKLSLWLRTAQKGRKLSNLSNNIKCGNSLIDAPEIAGAKAFDWYKEFPQVFKEKGKEAFHVVLTTHNSRTSKRMIELNIKKGEPFYLDLQQEINLTKIIGDIINEKKYHCVAYNICKDHVHLVIVCRPNELSSIVKTIKGKSSFMFQSNGFKPIGEPLWSQKFFFANLDVWELSTVSKRAGYCMDDDYIHRAMSYIKTNRQKHQLPESKELNKEISKFTESIEDAFCTEYYGGFDVVIGNPPYVKLEQIQAASKQLEQMNYKTYTKRGDLYVLFVEKGFELLKSGGLLSYIMPNKWLQADYGKHLRTYFLDNNISELIDFGDLQVFEGATTYPCIFNSQKDKSNDKIKTAVLNRNLKNDFYENVTQNQQILNTSELDENTWVISSAKDKAILDKVCGKFEKLEDVVEEANYGVKTGLSKAFFISNDKKLDIINSDANSSNIIFPFVQGRDISRYGSPKIENYLIGTFPAFSLNIDDFTGVKNHLLSFGKESLEQSGKKGSRKKTSNKWFETQDTIGYYNSFEKPKIMYQTFQVKPCFIYDESGLYCNNSMWIIPTDNKGLLAILNSKMGWWLISKYCTQIQNGYQLIWKYFGQIPVPQSNNELSSQADKMLALNKELQTKVERFIKRIQSNLEIEKTTKNLQQFYNFDFKTFLKELKKQKVKLSLSEQDEWEDYFEQYKTEINNIQKQINQTDKEIDRMVYELYELSPQEIEVVEEAVK